MNKNVFAKSILRQRVRSLLLLLLIGLAAFVFILRTVEFMVVRNQIMEIAGFYRSVGFLNADAMFGDVSGAVEILENSPSVDVVEQRRTAAAFLRDFYNADTTATSFDPISHQVMTYGAFFTVSRYSVVPADDLRVGNRRSYERAINAAIPEGVHIIGVHEGHRMRWQTHFHAHDVLAGNEDFVAPGQASVTLRYNTTFPAVSIFPNMTRDNHYLVRAFYDGLADYNIDEFSRGLFPVHGFDNVMQMIPLNWEGVNLRGEEPVYFIRFAPGEAVDLAAHGLEHLYQTMDEMNRIQRTMNLRTTTDMATLPAMLGGQPVIRILSGRGITRDDYVNARPVVVIHHQFARLRELEIGDTLAVSIPAEQRFSRIYTAGQFTLTPPPPGAEGFDPTVVETFSYIDLLVAGGVEDELAYEIELEIVGIFVNTLPGVTSRHTTPIYVPDSILPPNFEVLPPINAFGAMAGWTYGHMPDSWLSFTLVDSRYEQDFILQYGPVFAEMGLQLVIIGADSSNFWAVAQPMLTIVTFNAVMFWAVLLLVLALAVFLYLRSRVRYFAISRALGIPAKVALRWSAVSAMLLALPAIIGGGYAAWIVALRATGDTLAPLVGVVEGIDIVPSLHISWMFILMGIVLVGMLFMTLGGAVFILKRPVLELLQGNFAKKERRTKQRKEKKARLDWLFSRLGFSVGWILRHIVRQPVKTALGAAVAVFFMLALGWVQEAITRSQDGIDVLYDTTIVFVDVRPTGRTPMQVGHGAVGTHIAGELRSSLDGQVRDRSYAENIFTEAAHTRAFLLPAQPSDALPVNWYEIIGYDMTAFITQNVHALDFLYGFNNFDSFMFEHSRGFEDRFFDDIYVEFYDGFDGSIFAATMPVGVVPIVVYEGAMTERGFVKGEIVTMVYTRGMLSRTHMSTRSAVIAGTHNGEINRANLREAVLLPQVYMEDMLGLMTRFTTLNFTVDPSYNRDIGTVRDELEFLVPRGGLVTLSLFFLDEELRNAVVAMEQSVLVLELLYPIAVMLCVAIGAALAMLLAMQSDKNVAILRVLGTTKSKTCIVLIIEQLIVCAVGVFVGIAVVNGLGWGFGVAALVQLAGAYLGGTIIGLIVGAVKATSKAPIDLLQVRD